MRRSLHLQSFKCQLNTLFNCQWFNGYFCFKSTEIDLLISYLQFYLTRVLHVESNIVESTSLF